MRLSFRAAARPLRRLAAVLVGLLMAVMSVVAVPGVAVAANYLFYIEDPETYTCQEPGYISFEDLSHQTDLTSSGVIGGLQFTTLRPGTFEVRDFNTWITGAFNLHAARAAIVFVTDFEIDNPNAGRIDFVNGPASTFSFLVSGNTVSLEAYSSSGTLLESTEETWNNTPSHINEYARSMQELKIIRPSRDIAYVVVRASSGAPFVVDDICTNAPGVGTDTEFDGDLSLQMKVSDEPATAGEDLVYTITVPNRLPNDATDVAVTLIYPATATEWVSSTPSQGSCSRKTAIQCQLGTLPEGQVATITVAVKPLLSVAGQTLSSTATVTTTSSDPDLSNNYSAKQTLISSCTASALSGDGWAARVNDSRALEDLQGEANTGFEGDVKRFLTSLDTAGVTYHVNATYRPREVGYLMYWSWQVSNNSVSAGDVPEFKPARGERPVGICWVHRDPVTGEPNLDISKKKAEEQAAAYGLTGGVSPAKPGMSKHSGGSGEKPASTAIDLSTSWMESNIELTGSANEKFDLGNPCPTTVDAHCSDNKPLMDAADTYHVIHYGYRNGDPAQDWMHFSANGR